MKNLLMAAAAVSAPMIGPVSAATATYNFGQDAEDFDTATNQIEGTFDQVYNDVDSSQYGKNVQTDIYGIKIRVEAEAYKTVDNELVAADPFMDSISGGGIAGLGVCSTGFDTDTTGDLNENPYAATYGGESQCSTHYAGEETKNAGDDNLVSPEVLKLLFTNEETGSPLLVAIDFLRLRDANHNLVDTEIWISTDGTFGEGDLYNVIAGIVQGLGNLGASTMFWFTSNGQDPGDEIYLETMTVSAVPVPAGLPLLLAGLGGLGLIGRRRKSA